MILNAPVNVYVAAIAIAYVDTTNLKKIVKKLTKNPNALYLPHAEIKP